MGETDKPADASAPPGESRTADVDAKPVVPTPVPAAPVAPPPVATEPVRDVPNMRVLAPAIGRPKPAETAPATGAAPASEAPRASAEIPVPTVPKLPAPKSPAQTAAVPKATPPKAASAGPAAAKGGRYLVQLASVNSEAVAKREWARLQKRFPDEFGNRTLVVEKKEIAGRGTFYRVQASGYKSLDEARSVCAGLKAQKQGCLPVRR